MTQPDAISRLATPADYISARQHLFPSRTSFDWFVRTRRSKLVEKRAILMHGGRIFVDSPNFDAAVLELGHDEIAEAA